MFTRDLEAFQTTDPHLFGVLEVMLRLEVFHILVAKVLLADAGGLRPMADNNGGIADRHLRQKLVILDELLPDVHETVLQTVGHVLRPDTILAD